jgi:hypothetical protein
MAKQNKSYSVVITAAVAASALIGGAANAQSTQESEVIRSISSDRLVQPSVVSQNVTSVSQLSDVKPTDWAFTALQSLVERYGCIAGYPDRTFRGNQATSRYEFAAGLNACLDKINEIISAGLSDKVSKEDLATLQKLQEEFAAELATLRGRVDALDAKTAKLEAQQFSTTTKLRGEAIMALAAASDGVATPPLGSGGAAGVDRTNTTFSYRVRLNFDTSFTGKDLLRTRLESANNPNLAGSTANPALANGTNAARLSFDTNTGNTFNIGRLFYRFPIGDSITAYIAAIGAPEDVISPLNPLESDGQGTISRFGRFNPLIRIASGGNPAIAGLNFKLNSSANLELMYSAANAATASGPGGVGGDDTKLAAQLVYKPSSNLTLGAGYGYSYNTGNNLGSGLNVDNIGSPAGLIGLKTHTVVGSLIWDITKKVTFNTWGSWNFSDGINNAGTTIGSTTFTSWMAALSTKDLFSEGDLAALLFGQPMFRTSVSGAAATSPDTPYHLEALYRFRVSRNISITPGVFFVFNQGSNSANGTATVGVIRTTFSF